MESGREFELHSIPLRQGSQGSPYLPYRGGSPDSAPLLGSGSPKPQSSPPAIPSILQARTPSSFGLGIKEVLDGNVKGSQTSTPGRNSSYHSRALSDPTAGPEITPCLNDMRKSPNAGTGKPWAGSTSTIFPNGPSDTRRDVSCPSRTNILHGARSWISIAILTLAFYSTALSGLYFIVAAIKPRYEDRIGSKGLAPATASLISAFLSKTVELSFVTVFVAFLGQILSRKALARNTTGITLADMSMRAWVMQPGTLITHWQNVKYSGLSLLGVFALTTTIVAMLYTTAADALVSPKLQLGKPEPRNMTCQIRSKFANTSYLFENCQTPITIGMDPTSKGSTCMQISYSGQAFHNYKQYLANWADLKGSGSPDMNHRLPPVGTWYDNTTVEGSWIEKYDMKRLSSKYGRVVINVTAAMPHSGVFVSSRHPANAIPQPEDFADGGEFFIQASVPSPIVNVICAGMTAEDLEPMVYTKWPNADPDFNPAEWLDGENIKEVPVYPDWLNETSVDDVFEFGKKFGKRGQRPPVFPKLPLPYNTMVNGTGIYPENSIYILGATPLSVESPYFLCQLRGGLTPHCSTNYHAAASGGRLTTSCNAKDNGLEYSRHAHGMAGFEVDPDWKNVAQEWANSVGLDSGRVDGNGSNARLITQLFPLIEFTTPPDSEEPEPESSPLQTKLPSVAEALAVLASPLLLFSTEHTPFNHLSNMTREFEEAKGQPIFHEYRALLRISGYASGGSGGWQSIFYVILALVFLTNIVCMVYMYADFRGVQITDFTEPQNTIVLALNSPPSNCVSGACGGGPEGRELKERWIVTMDENDEHFYMASRAETKEALVRNQYTDKHKRNVSNATDFDVRSIETQDGPMENDEDKGDLKQYRANVSPRISEYRRLSRAKSSIALWG
ncbi:hypothetical protein FQN57_004326 [Myotisia sp. PD_48]|nr:hypothetical protein FQN57_004326 [Myotisia sp. PD_48]